MFQEYLEHHRDIPNTKNRNWIQFKEAAKGKLLIEFFSGIFFQRANGRCFTGYDFFTFRINGTIDFSS